jgi:hypothetical protein
MSGIAAISGSNFDLFQWIVQATAQNGDPLLAAPSGVSRSEVGTAEVQGGTTGVDAGNLSNLQEAIRSAVSSAVEEAEKSGNTTNLYKVIYDAVLQALKDNGIDPTKLQGHHKGHHRHHGQTGGVGQPDATANTTDSTTNNTIDSTTDDTSSAENQPSSQIDPRIGDFLAQLLASQDGSRSLTGYLLDQKQ